ncbi:MAG: GumC family protein, partial [Limisphaerales bacterium]
MNTPMLPAPEPEFQPAPSHEEPVSRSALRFRRFLMFLPKYWWIPVLTLTIGIVIGAAYVRFKTPTFYSDGTMWQSLRLTLPGEEYFSDDVRDYAVTLGGVLQSEPVHDLALELLRASTNRASILLGKDGQPLPIGITVSGRAGSSLYQVQATGSNPLFTRTYLDAAMQAYLEYTKTVRNQVSGDTLTSLSDQMQRWDQDLKSEQDTLLAFERTNNLAILQEEASVAGTYLTQLRTQLSDLQLEGRLLNDVTNTSALGTNASFTIAADMTSSLPPGATATQQAALNDLEQLKIQRARLSKYLRPKHPKLVALDEQIARAEQMQQVYQHENQGQLTAERQANQIKARDIMLTIKEWETKVSQANAAIAQADRLKLNIQQTQNVYDRLDVLVQNLGISRDIDQGTLSILAQASPTKRSYTSEKQGLVLA